MSKVYDGIYGVIVGDMLGVPVEFERRENLEKDPVTGPREGGSHEQPLGAWSDDTSLTLALADSFREPFELRVVAKNFIDWWQYKKYTSHDCVFDIGERTRLSLNNLLKILESKDYESLKYLHYEADEKSNGNGSLMRILPLYFPLQHTGIEGGFETIRQVSALTHPHIRSALACLIYLIMLDEMQRRDTLLDAYSATQVRAKDFFNTYQVSDDEWSVFSRIIHEDISSLSKSEITTDGYVVHTLEAAFWCLLSTNSYQESVLKAVNLGGDTDTTGAVTGGLAGFWYGFDAIPQEWLNILPKKNEINDICDYVTRKW